MRNLATKPNGHRTVVGGDLLSLDPVTRPSLSTPNGVVDILSGGEPPSPVSPFPADDDEVESGSRWAQNHPSPLGNCVSDHSDSIYVKKDVKKGGEDDDKGDIVPPRKAFRDPVGSIYARLDSFEEKLECELRELAELGVGELPRDPDGNGARPPIVISTPNRKRGKSVNAIATPNGKRGKSVKSGKRKKFVKLSHKTQAIMSAYKAYIAEIQTPVISYNNDEQHAILNMQRAKDEIRDSYEVVEEGANTHSPTMVRDDGHTTGNGQLWPVMLPKTKNQAPTTGCAAGVFDERLLALDNQGMAKNHHPWFASKKAKRGIFTILLAATILGVVAGLIKGEQRKRLPNWEADYAEVEQEGEEDAANLTGWQGTVVVVDGNEMQEIYNAEIKKEETMNQEYYVKLEQRHSPPEEAGHQQTYYDAVVKYQPKMFDRSKGWKGRRYVDALIFCEETVGLAICPYSAICPYGRGGEPLGGFRKGDRDNWAWLPIIDHDNSWVQAGPRDGCTRYSSKFGENPHWGITGEDNDDITRNVMCCLNVV